MQNFGISISQALYNRLLHKDQNTAPINELMFYHNMDRLH